MRYTLALVAAAGLTFATARETRAQFSITVGSPYWGGSYLGSSYGYGFGYPGYYGYGYGAPGYYASTFNYPYSTYSSGYLGVRPYYGVRSYAAPAYGYGYGYRYPGYYGYRGYYGSRVGVPGLGIANRVLGGIFGGRRYYAPVY